MSTDPATNYRFASLDRFASLEDRTNRLLIALTTLDAEINDYQDATRTVRAAHADVGAAVTAATDVAGHVSTVSTHLLAVAEAISAASPSELLNRQQVLQTTLSETSAYLRFFAPTLLSAVSDSRTAIIESQAVLLDAMATSAGGVHDEVIRSEARVLAGQAAVGENLVRVHSDVRALGAFGSHFIALAASIATIQGEVHAMVDQNRMLAKDASQANSQSRSATYLGTFVSFLLVALLLIEFLKFLSGK